MGSLQTFGIRVAIVAAVFASWTLPVQAADILRAHYEIQVAGQGAENKVRSTFQAKPGEQVTLELRPNVVAMSVQPLANGEYQLRVTVTPEGKSAAVFNETFKGTMGRPLELKSASESVQLDGAISVVLLKQ